MPTLNPNAATTPLRKVGGQPVEIPFAKELIEIEEAKKSRDTVAADIKARAAVAPALRAAYGRKLDFRGHLTKNIKAELEAKGFKCLDTGGNVADSWEITW